MVKISSHNTSLAEIRDCQHNSLLSNLVESRWSIPYCEKLRSYVYIVVSEIFSKNASFSPPVTIVILSLG